MKWGLSLEDEASMYGFRGVDFDGTLCRDDINGNQPVMPMVHAVRKWIADGEDVIIFTARGWQKPVEDFCLKYFGKILTITNIKLRGLSAWYDDRAIQVEANTGRILDGSALDRENKKLKEEVNCMKAENGVLAMNLADIEERLRKMERLVARLKMQGART